MAFLEFMKKLKTKLKKNQLFLPSQVEIVGDLMMFGANWKIVELENTLSFFL